MTATRACAASWGRYPRVVQHARPLTDRDAPLPASDTSWLPYGNGRSYGDSCLNDGGGVLLARGLDRFIGFDPQSGVLACEAGVLLADILALAVPQGWFLPVTPGTRYVTVGGALANDVHGKNHHRAGSFGRHLRGFELLRSDGSRRWCSAHEHADWYGASIGGLGLTGLVTRVELQLRRIANPWIAGETIRFGSLAEFDALSAESDAGYEYTVAWIDCAAAAGRGLFMRGNHAPALPRTRPAAKPGRLRVPFVPPVSLINGPTLHAFNALYYHRPVGGRECTQITHYEPFFYPLDGIGDWNRIYGPHGFLQWQCALPPAAGLDALHAILAQIAASGSGSFLAVLKRFGELASPGWLSFPRPGYTLALDFPNRGAATFALLDRLDAVVREAAGAIYPAKDARMSGALFRAAYPRWQRFADYLDPQFSSSFWRRVMA